MALLVDGLFVHFGLQYNGLNKIGISLKRNRNTLQSKNVNDESYKISDKPKIYL